MVFGFGSSSSPPEPEPQQTVEDTSEQWELLVTTATSPFPTLTSPLHIQLTTVGSEDVRYRYPK